jgi:hypothetical protein
MVPRVTRAKGWYLYRENNVAQQLVTCLKWTASETLCVERISTVYTWNMPTNGLVLPHRAAVTERWYYADPIAHAFVSLTNREIQYLAGKWTTNYVPTWPQRIVEPPLAIVGRSVVEGPNGQKIAEGDLCYAIDARRCTNDWWIVFTFRASPVSDVGSERYVKFYVQSAAGSEQQWVPDLQAAQQFSGPTTWLKAQGYAPVLGLPANAQGVIVSSRAVVDPNQVKYE